MISEERTIDLRGFRRGAWVTHLLTSEPRPTVDDRLEIIESLPVTTRGLVSGKRKMVRAGEILAWRYPGTQGTLGRGPAGEDRRDRPPRQIRLPSGMNTLPNEDETRLTAACDGEARMVNRRIEVIPMRIHEGDIPAGTRFTAAVHGADPGLGLCITGSVREHAWVEWHGDIHVEGGILDARVISREGSIHVAGDIVGSSPGATALFAHADITCMDAQRSDLTAQGDLHILGAALSCTVEAGGNLLLGRALGESVPGTVIRVGGGLYPPINPGFLPDIDLADRRLIRVPTLLPAMISPHDGPPPRFQSCIVLDLSPFGARIRVEDAAPALSLGAMAQFRLLLPATSDPVFAIGRVLRVSSRGERTVVFVQMPSLCQDQLVAFCAGLQASRERGSIIITREDAVPMSGRFVQRTG